MQEITMFKEVPGYRPILRAVIKNQIHNLIHQLAQHTGEESVLISASIEEGTLSHIGSDFGKNFIDGHAEIKAQFLGFCLKRNHINKATQGDPQQFTRKKGPFPGKARPQNKAFTEDLRHQPYPRVAVPHVQSENEETSHKLTYQKQASISNQSVFPGKVKLQENQNQSLLPKIKDENQSTGNVSRLQTTNKNGSNVLSFGKPLVEKENNVDMTEKVVKTKIEETESQKEKESQDRNSQTQKENAPEQTKNQNADKMAEDAIDLSKESQVVKSKSPVIKEEKISENGITDETSFGNYQYTLATSTPVPANTLGTRKSSRKSLEPRRNITNQKFSHLDYILDKITPIKPDLGNSVESRNNNYLDAKGKVEPNLNLLKKEVDDLTERCQDDSKQELENFLYLDHSSRPYPCALCPKRFKERHHLIYHMRTHSGHRPYICNICGKRFTQSSSLNTHKKIHFKDLHCQVCSRVFRKQAEYLNHACVPMVSEGQNGALKMEEDDEVNETI